MGSDERIQLDILYKRLHNKASTSINKEYYEERDAPESRYPVYPALQLYTQAHLLTDDVPSDLHTLTGSDADDAGGLLSGSFYGKTSEIVKVLRRYIKVPLVSIPSPCGKAFQTPYCIKVTNASQFVIGETMYGMVSGARGIVVSKTSTNIFFKSTCGIPLQFQSNEIVKGRTSNSTSTVIQDTQTCPLSRVMQNVVPFDFGRGGYSYKIFRADDSQLYFGEGKWLLDTFSGILTFYGTIPQGISDTLLPSISFYKYVGKVGLNTTHNINGNVGIGTENPDVSLYINTTDALRFPSGNTAQRPDPAQQGYTRYNTDLHALEFYDCCEWLDLSKGLGPDSNGVNIGTGGSDRQIVIGNTTGSTGISMLAGAGDISLSSADNISLDANSNISLHTRAPNGPSHITIGNHDPNLTILLQADGSNSGIELNGPVNLTGLSNIAVSGAYNYGSGSDDNNWRSLQLPTPGNPTTTSWFLQKRIAGTWTTRMRVD